MHTTKVDFQQPFNYSFPALSTSGSLASDTKDRTCNQDTGDCLKSDKLLQVKQLNG